MPTPPHNPSAKKRTATRALRLTKKIQAEIEQDLAAYNAHVEKHGSPGVMLRDYLADRDNPT